MSTTVLSPLTVQHFTDNNGNPLAGGLLYTYAAGTSTPQATYIDSTGVTANTNPVVLNTRGEANVWMAANQTYKFSLFDASSNLIWTVDQINSSASGIYPSVLDFGAKGDGVTDDTLAINAANITVTALRKTLFFPAGTYIATQLNVLAYQNWVGEDVAGTIIKLKNGTNPIEGSSALIWSPDHDRDEASFANFTFDGNSSGNTQGDTMVLSGCRTRIKNCKVNNSASSAITTSFNASSAERLSGIESSFMDITIDSPQKNGWLHYGPNDSNFDGVIIIDAGKKTNNTYYGMYLASNGRLNNVHPWNRDSSTNIAAASVHVISAGNTFTNCHVEGGIISLNLLGGANSFSACAFYAPRGNTCVFIASSSSANTFSACVSGLVYASSNQHYTILNVSGGLNKIDLTLNGANSGVFFADTASGNNIVTLTGYLQSYTGQFLYNGTYATTDQINLLVGGTGGGTVMYPAVSGTPTTASSFTSSITPSLGSFTASIAAAYYYQIGKLVHFDVYYNIASVDTANGFLQITLPGFCTANSLGSAVGSNPAPATMEGHFSGGSINYMSFTNYNGASPTITAGNGHVAGWYITT